MKARIVSSEDVLKIVDLLRREYEVIAPFCGRDQDTFYDVVTDQNRDQIQLHLHNPLYPPKRYVLPHIERMFLIRSQEDGNYKVQPTWDDTPRAIFGIRSCDLAGIGHVDRFYLGRKFIDPYYLRRRRNLFLVNMVCTEPGVDITPNCFCLCTDTGPAAREGFDLQLMDLGDVYLVVAGSKKGEAFLENPLFRKGGPEHLQRRREILERVRHSFQRQTTSWFSATVRYISQGKVLEKTWEEIGRRCLECGACSYVCPTCTCFTVNDRRIEPGQTERIRLWDSCALQGFTRMAGGFNPRKAVHDRRNRRFFHKLVYYFIQEELSLGCVGCGRCEIVCHGDIGMPSVVEMIRRATVKEETHNGEAA